LPPFTVPPRPIPVRRHRDHAQNERAQGGFASPERAGGRGGHRASEASECPPTKLTEVLSGMTLLSSMSNNAPSDNVVLRHAVEQIQSSLPSHWSTNVATKTNDVAAARLTIKTPAGASAALAIGARRQLDPRLVPEVAEALRTAAADAFVVVAPFLGPRTRERLAEEGIG